MSPAVDRSQPGSTIAPDALEGERWGALATFLLATFYIAVLVWLALFVVVPTIGWGLQSVVVTSGSMQPIIRPGDVVLLRPVADGPALQPGTVITYADPARSGSLLTHRVVGVAPDGRYRTRGDANADADSALVEHSAVIGAGRLLIPLIGLPVVWLHTAPALVAAWLALTAAALGLAARPPATASETP